jgi:4-hydroxyphenylpyruvate dioxygenase
MTARSIATVSLSGSLDEKLRAIAAAGFDAVEIFENDLLSFNGSPRTSDSSAATLVSQFAHSSRFEISRACPSPSAPATSQEPNASST